jgi:hypothetical protein
VGLVNGKLVVKQVVVRAGRQELLHVLSLQAPVCPALSQVQLKEPEPFVVA